MHLKVQCNLLSCFKFKFGCLIMHSIDHSIDLFCVIMKMQIMFKETKKTN